MARNFIDRCFEAVAPVHAVRRSAARTALQFLNSGYGNYGANLTKKSMRGWEYHGGSSKEDIEDNIDVLRQRSRDAYMGVPVAASALKTLRTNVVAGGLMPAPQIDGAFLGLSAEQTEELQEKIIREFSLWADTPECDMDGLGNFYKLQQLAYLGYGDISDSTWWGDEVTPKQFAEDLDKLGAVSEITVRINSGGGDVFAAQTIGNLLEQHPANVVARIDGLCASSATIVACHCDRVVAANDSTYMVHPVRLGLLGYYDATTMQQYLNALDTIKENIISLYAKKTGRDKEEVTGWMDATSWWTGQEAKDNGFVDELVEDVETPVVENRNGVLFVNSVNMHLPFDKAPTFMQNSLAAPTAAGRFVNKPGAMKPGVQHEEVQNMEIKTADDLRQAYPALVDQIEQAAADRATNEERERIRDIEEMALPGSEEITAEAKFTKPVSASDYAKAAMKRAKEQGNEYLNNAKTDAKNSGAGTVENTPPAGKTDEFLDAIKSVGQNAQKK